LTVLVVLSSHSAWLIEWIFSHFLIKELFLLSTIHYRYNHEQRR
jgi:hypothetical protein